MTQLSLLELPPPDLHAASRWRNPYHDHGVVVPALSLWAPYAGLVVDGLKPFETRWWRTKYRGDVAIHGGRSAAPSPSPSAWTSQEAGMRFDREAERSSTAGR